jgi:hypothetical protein
VESSVRRTDPFAYDDRAEGVDQARAGSAEFVAMREREAREEACAARRYAQQDLAGVGTAARADEQSFGFEAAAQLDGAVVADLQALGESADGGRNSQRQSLKSEQSLMLLRLNAGGASRVLAEIQEAADFVTESGEGLVVDCMAMYGHAYIISYYDIK